MSLQKVDQYVTRAVEIADWVPVASTVTNGVGLVALSILRFLPESSHLKNHFKEKTFTHMILLLIPVANVAVACHFLASRYLNLAKKLTEGITIVYSEEPPFTPDVQNIVNQLKKNPAISIPGSSEGFTKKLESRFKRNWKIESVELAKSLESVLSNIHRGYLQKVLAESFLYRKIHKATNCRILALNLTNFIMPWGLLTH